MSWLTKLFKKEVSEDVLVKELLAPAQIITVPQIRRTRVRLTLQQEVELIRLYNEFPNMRKPLRIAFGYKNSNSFCSKIWQLKKKHKVTNGTI